MKNRSSFLNLVGNWWLLGLFWVKSGTSSLALYSIKILKKSIQSEFLLFTFSCRTTIPNISVPLKAPIEYPSSKISEMESSKAGILQKMFFEADFLQKILQLFTCTPKDTNQYWQHKVHKGKNFASGIPDFAQYVQTK